MVGFAVSFLCHLLLLLLLLLLFMHFVLCTLSIAHLCAIDTRLINATCLLVVHCSGIWHGGHFFAGDIAVAVRRCAGLFSLVIWWELDCIVNRVRMIPSRAPNMKYPIILASSDTNTQSSLGHSPITFDFGNCIYIIDTIQKKCLSIHCRHCACFGYCWLCPHYL